ncbi:MAG TPA: GWxTD domain-containing protein [Pyrinomonadaceae bacterium]|nr:GWxTD domain-containing protein [Pyrinomonadaceae bacterium]
MFSRDTLRVSILVGLVFAVPQAFAQKTPPNSDPQSKPRKVRLEPDKAFTDWVRDVEPIISADELNAWRKLRTNEEREQFIGDFWHRRDPDPDTEENEYREAYYERVAYVNEHFASGIPGYKTDRGRIYLKYGKPNDVESHPAGGSYERQPNEGGGSTSTYPFERWFYRNIPGRSGADIEFVDPTGTGEYRLARNPFEKEALLMVPGAAPTFDGVSQADRVAAANGIGNPFSMREQDSPFNWQELMGILGAPLPAPKYDPFGEGITGTPKIEDNPLSFDASFGFFRLDDNRVVTTITVQTDNRDLSFHDSGGIQVATINITGRIINIVGRRVNLFEDAVSTTATTEELIEAKERKSAYQKTVVLAPGHYKADLLVRDTRAGASGLHQIGFIVPRFGSDLATSSLILASVLHQVADETASRQFMIGDQKVIPNISGAFHRGSPIGVYMQIYNAGIDQTTLRPAIDVEYALMKDGKELSKQIEDWRGSSTAGERLTLSRLIDSRGLAPGDYSVEVRVRDHVSGQSLVQSAKFTIVP